MTGGQRARLIVLSTSLALFASRNAEATSCAGHGGSIATDVRMATAIVVGRVEEVVSPEPHVTEDSGGRVTISISTGQPSRVSLAIEDTFKGSVTGKLVFDSTFNFVEGARYVIYGATSPDRLVVHSCSRIVALAEADAALRYLNGVRAGARPGVLYGQVSLASDDRFQPLSDAVVVISSAADARHETRVGPYGRFTIVLSPGAYSMWVERQGRQVTNPEQLVVAEGDVPKNFLVAAVPGDFARDRSITPTAIGPIVLGATLAEARREVPNAKFRRIADGDGVALVVIDLGPDESIIVWAGEDEPTAPIDWSQTIQSIETFSPRFTINGLIAPGTTVDYAAMVWGPVQQIVRSEIESREYVEFAQQPPGFTLRLDPGGARILSISVAKSSRR